MKVPEPVEGKTSRSAAISFVHSWRFIPQTENLSEYCDFHVNVSSMLSYSLPENGKPCGVLRRFILRDHIFGNPFLKMENPAGYCDYFCNVHYLCFKSS
jgi:hypothetical protein